MAVIVQLMARCTVGGVAFTCDPRSRDRRVIVIEAARGLAESVVRGGASEQYRVGVVGIELHRLAAADDQPAARTILAEAEILALARFVKRVEGAFGDGEDPVDVEWGYEAGQVTLLQVRPVSTTTKLPYTVSSESRTIWSNASFRDAFPGVQTPLGWTLLRPVLDSMLIAPILDSGYRLECTEPTHRLIRERPYYNLTALQWLYLDAIGVAPEDLNRALGG